MIKWRGIFFIHVIFVPISGLLRAMCRNGTPKWFAVCFLVTTMHDCVTAPMTDHTCQIVIAMTKVPHRDLSNFPVPGVLNLGVFLVTKQTLCQKKLKNFSIPCQWDFLIDQMEGSFFLQSILVYIFRGFSGSLQKWYYEMVLGFLFGNDGACLFCLSADRPYMRNFHRNDEDVSPKIFFHFSFLQC